MIGEAKIPTLLGLGILIIGLASGVFLVTNKQLLSLQTKAAPVVSPQNINVANLTDTSASIYWQTAESTQGFIQAGTTPSLGLTFKDERDLQAPQPHKLHFVTLTNLSPDTTYYYKINSGSSVYPDAPTSFKTTPSLMSNNNPTIVGTVLNPQLQPSDEAIVSMTIPGAQNMATITKVSGNFILPLASLKNEQLNDDFNFSETPTAVTIKIFDALTSSQITLNLPGNETTLPPIILGKDLTITPHTASPSPTSSLGQYDLNQDGVVNSLDLSVILNNSSKKPKDKRADLNQDGVVDQKDIDIISKFIPRISK